MLVNFTVKQLAYFVGAAETGSTTVAAQRFFMNQSSMSASLTELETALGIQLFIRRRGKGVELTSAGHALLPEARRLVREAEEFGTLAGTLQESLSGRLSIGCFSTIAPAILPRLMRRFQELHPQVEIDFVEGGQDELYRALSNGQMELSFMYDHDLPQDLDHTVFSRPMPHVLVSADHALASADSVSLQDMVDQPFIMIETSPARPLTMAVFASVDIIPRIRFTSPNFDHIKSLVHEGMGYTMISQEVGTTPPHWSENLVAVPISGQVPRQDVVLANMPRTRLTRRASAFRDFCLKGQV